MQFLIIKQIYWHKKIWLLPYKSNWTQQIEVLIWQRLVDRHLC
jgi:hypothetical protein